MVRDPDTGKYRRTRLFVLTLGYSRKSVRLLVWRSSAQIWAELHEQAFRRLGGAPRVVVLDNLREGVLTPDIYDPALNPLYRDVLAHYGVVALPCRVRDPDRKGKVERGVGHAQKTPLKGLRFESLEEAQAYLDRWEERWADTRIHGTTKRQVAAMFAEEKPALLPLPARAVPLLPATASARCTSTAASRSRPPTTARRRAGSAGACRCSGTSCTCGCSTPQTGQLLREHLRQQRGRHRIQDEDRPARTPRTHRGAAARARHAGTAHRRALPAHPPHATASPACAASSACSRWPRSTASALSTTAAPGRARARRARPTASSAATSSAGRRCRSPCARSIR